MAVVVMASANDDNAADPIFHDFLGMSCGEAPPPVWANLGPGARSVEVPEASTSVSVSAASPGAPSHGFLSGGSDLASGPEVSNQLLGRKRSSSDSAFMGLLRERGLQMASEPPESSRTLKMFPREGMNERHARLHDDVVFTSQYSLRPVSATVQSHISGRTDLASCRWEQTTPLSPAMLHHTSRFGKCAVLVDKVSACSHKESTTTAPYVSQAAADEGSRTGIKDSRLLNVITSVGGSARKAVGTLPCSTRVTAIPQISELESSNMISRCGISTSGRQMTIFYAGQAHVFDDVHPNKADIIMALAGSNGGSWSTSFSAKTSIRPTGVEPKMPGVEIAISNVSFPQDLNARISVHGNPSHGPPGQVRGIPALGDSASILTPGTAQPYFSATRISNTRPLTKFVASEGGRAVRDMRPTQATEIDAGDKRNL